MRNKTTLSITLVWVCTIIIFWVIGAVLACLNETSVLCIDSHLISLCFWGPYAISMGIFMVTMIVCVLKNDDGKDRRR